MKYLIIFSIVALIASCGGSSKSNAQLSLSFVTAGGVNMPGGLLLYGYNRTTSKASSYKFTNSNRSFILENGTWDFFVIGWSGTENLEGNVYCGGSVSTLEGGDIPINIQLAQGKCNNPSSHLQKIIGFNEFKSLRFYSCKNMPATIDAGTNCSSNNGNINSLRLQLRTSGDEQQITSKCFDISSNPSTGIKIPYGSQVFSAIDTAIIGYATTDCNGPQEKYRLPNGVINESLALFDNQTSEYAFFSNPGLAKIFITDQIEKPFITTWETTSASESITLPLKSSGTYDFTVDWGDGSPIDTITAYDDSAITHTYAVADTYMVKIKGTLSAWSFNNSGSKDKLKTVETLGDVGWLDLSSAFFGCNNLTLFRAGPETRDVTTMIAMFRDTPLLSTIEVSNMDTSSVTNFSAMFKEAVLANPDTSNWDTSSATTMASMFYNADAANPDTTNWNTSSVTVMSGMFSKTAIADPDTTNWDTSSVTTMASMFYQALNATPNTTNWNTVNVVTMASMFFSATSANPDTSSWNTSNVTTMATMFKGASNANPDTSSWSTSSVTSMASMFNGASNANPDTSGWNTSSVTDMSGMFFNAAAANPMTSGWDVSSVINMSNMFANAATANPDTSGWDVSSVTDMASMFSNATVADPDMSNWDFLSVSDMSDFFLGSSLSVNNYSAMLISLSSTNPAGNLAFDAGGLDYNASAVAAFTTLTSTNSWSIINTAQE